MVRRIKALKFNTNLFDFFFIVIYDDDITRGLVKTILKLFKSSPKLQEMYMALEKRYVFTDCVCAPMYESFIQIFSEETAGILRCDEISIEFPQYFDYKKCKELVLMKVIRRWK